MTSVAISVNKDSTDHIKTPVKRPYTISNTATMDFWNLEHQSQHYYGY